MHYYHCFYHITMIIPFPFQFVMLFSIANFTPVTYGSYTYPAWALGLGWVFAMFSIVPLPVVAIVETCQARGPILQASKNFQVHV